MNDPISVSFYPILFYAMHFFEKEEYRKEDYIGTPSYWQRNLRNLKIHRLTEEGCMIGKWPAEHGLELYPNPKLLIMAEAYFYATFGPKISDFFDSCLHWVSVVCA